MSHQNSFSLTFSQSLCNYTGAMDMIPTTGVLMMVEESAVYNVTVGCDYEGHIISFTSFWHS